jgi:hypothetical protein
MLMFVLVLPLLQQFLDDNVLDLRQNMQTRNHNIFTIYIPYKTPSPELPVMDDNYGPIFIFFSINASAFEESV